MLHRGCSEHPSICTKAMEIKHWCLYDSQPIFTVKKYVFTVLIIYINEFSRVSSLTYCTKIRFKMICYGSIDLNKKYI